SPAVFSPCFAKQRTKCYARPGSVAKQLCHQPVDPQTEEQPAGRSHMAQEILHTCSDTSPRRISVVVLITSSDGPVCFPRDSNRATLCNRWRFLPALNKIQAMFQQP